MHETTLPARHLEMADGVVCTALAGSAPNESVPHCLTMRQSCALAWRITFKDHPSKRGGGYVLVSCLPSHA